MQIRRSLWVPLRWGCALPSPNAPGKAPNHIHTTLRWGRAPGAGRGPQELKAAVAHIGPQEISYSLLPVGSNCPPPRSGPHACRRAGAGGVRWRVGTAHRVALKLGHRLERRPTQPEAAPSCQGHGGRWGTAGCRAPQFLCTMPVTSAHPPRRSEPSNEQTGLNVCWGSVSAGDHFERDWRSKQSRVGKGPAWGRLKSLQTPPHCLRSLKAPPNCLKSLEALLKTCINQGLPDKQS